MTPDDGAFCAECGYALPSHDWGCSSVTPEDRRSVIRAVPACPDCVRSTTGVRCPKHTKERESK